MDHSTTAFWLAILSLIANIIVAIFTATTYLAQRNLAARLKEDALNQKMHELQTQYSIIRAKMNIKYRQEEWRPSKDVSTEWCPIEEYWFFCFHEWLLTKGPNSNNFNNLWDDHIKVAIQAGLSHKPLRYVLREMRRDGTLSQEYANQFIEALKQLTPHNFDIEEF